MNQVKIGSFLKELRTERGLTQIQLAEKLNTTNRSVSRWETGSTLPDISVLIELADFYKVDIREIVDGERKSETMPENTKETLETVARYSKTADKKKLARVVVLMAAAFVLVLGLVIFFSSRRSAEVFIDTYPAYERVYLDGKTADGLLCAYVSGNMSEPEGNAANFSAVSIFSSEEFAENRYYTYAWVMESVYSCEDGVLREGSASSYPCRFTLARENGALRVTAAELPGDGGEYTKGIQRLFPGYVREMIGRVQEDGTVASLSDDLLTQAKASFGME